MVGARGGELQHSSSHLKGDNEYERMLSTIAQDLTLPLLQIKAKSELYMHEGKSGAEFGALTDSGLKLIEGYLTALEVSINNKQLALEPVTIGSVLNETADELRQFARQYHTELSVEVAGRSKPVLTDKAKLKAAFYCLAASLIRSQSGTIKEKRIIILAAHRNSAESMTAGVFGAFSGMADKELYSARRLAGKAAQPMPSLSAQNGGGILVADMLMSLLYQPLKAARLRELNGFAAQLPLSKQLKFV